MRVIRKSFSTVICKTVAGAHTGQEIVVRAGSNDELAGWSGIYPVFHGMSFALYDGEVTVEVRQMKGEQFIETTRRTRFKFGGGKWEQIKDEVVA